MSIVGDGRDERQIRVDRMIAEFRDAQSRRLAKAAAAKGDDQRVADSKGVASDNAGVSKSTTTPSSH
jgi:hypothetical protein